MIRDLARKVAREKIAPHAADVDERERYPEEAMQAIVEAGLFGIWVPEAYGGSDLGCLALSVVSEEIAWACAASATQFVDQALGGLPILDAGTAEQKQRYLPKIASGELLTAYSLSEAEAGSDAAALKTTAVRRGDHYVLNGSKQWCTNGDHADVICLFATVDPTRRARGVTAFLVDTSTPGFTVGKKERKMGIRGSPTVSLHLHDCHVPVAQRLGEEGEGFAIAMRTLDVRARPPARWPWASPRPRWTPPSATPRSDGSSASASPISRGSSSCWPTWPCRSTPRGSWSTTPPGKSTPGYVEIPTRPPWPSAVPGTPP